MDRPPGGSHQRGHYDATENRRRSVRRSQRLPRRRRPHPRRRHHSHGAAQGRRPDRHRPGRLRLDGQALRRRGRQPRSLATLRRSKKLHNDITPVAQKLCAYLARKIDADGGTTCIYWAVGPGGGQIEVVGDLTADQAEKHVFGPPRDFGTGTQLLPAVKYFVERFKDAPWGFYVFITDGELHDLDAVKDYSSRLAQDVSAGRRNPLKFVLIGIGADVNEAQMEELDDLDTGTDVDLWDHKLAAEMRVLQEIFAEVVDKNARVSDHGRILDPNGRVVKDYSDTGLPAFLEFEMPAGAELFHPRRERPAHQSGADRPRRDSNRPRGAAAGSCGRADAAESASAASIPAAIADGQDSSSAASRADDSDGGACGRRRPMTDYGAASSWNSTRKAPRRRRTRRRMCNWKSRRRRNRDKYQCSFAKNRETSGTNYTSRGQE